VLRISATITIITLFAGKGRAKVWHIGGKYMANRWHLGGKNMAGQKKTIKG